MKTLIRFFRNLVRQKPPADNSDLLALSIQYWKHRAEVTAEHLDLCARENHALRHRIAELEKRLH